ncbi:MAG: hypothetical protein AB1522_13750 [Chloroflexota bacterium]
MVYGLQSHGKEEHAISFFPCSLQRNNTRQNAYPPLGVLTLGDSIGLFYTFEQVFTMNFLTPFLSLDLSANRAREMILGCLKRLGVNPIQTFDFQMSCKDSTEVFHSPINPSDCEAHIMVFLVHDEEGIPLTLSIYSRGNRSYFSVTQPNDNPNSHPLFLLIQQILCSNNFCNREHNV